MSFSTQVKAELCRAPLNRKCCAQAEAYGVLLYCSLSTSTEVRITTESPEFADRLPQLFQKAFQVRFDRLPAEGAGKRIFSITAPDKLSALWSVFGHDPAEALVHHINYAVLEEEHCRTAFLRGAFLAAGSLSAPEKFYACDIACASMAKAQQLKELIATFGIEAKIVERKKYFVVYIKEGSQIVDILNVMEAPVALMELENIRILKEMRNSVNRQVNCETANINKTVSAAVKQIEDIRYIEEKAGLKSLPANLQEMARVRLENPDGTLKELGEALDPPVGKSGVNHRLRKLSLLAEELRSGSGSH